MATISVGAGNYCRPYRNVRVQHFPEDASQTFKRGELVIFSSTGGKEDKIKIAGADPTALMLGVAAADASGTEGTKIPVWVFAPDAEFIIHYDNGRTVNRANLGSSFGVVRDATNVIWRLDDTETTAKVFEVVQLIDGHGDVNGRVIVRPTTATMKQSFGVN